MRFLPPVPAPPAGRHLACVRCGALVAVYELPRPFLDAAAYRCGECKVERVPYGSFPHFYGRPKAVA